MFPPSSRRLAACLLSLAAGLAREGHRTESHSWEEVRTELRPAALRVELRLKFGGRDERRRFYFYESTAGEKIIVEATGEAGAGGEG